MSEVTSIDLENINIGSSENVSLTVFGNLTLNEYQKRAESTAIYPNLGKNIYYPTLGLCGEAGEVSEKVKKLMRDHNGILTEDYKLAIAKELGDVLYYVAMTSFEIGFSLEEIALLNNEKLSSRKQRNQIQGSGDNR